MRIVKKEAVILHTVGDARDYVSRKIQGQLLLSTSPSVDLYLKYESDLECICLSRFLSYDRIQAQIDISISKTEKLINQLDMQYSDLLSNVNEMADSKIFNTLYSFVIKYMYAPYATILTAINTLIEQHAVSKLFIYDLTGFSLLGCKTRFIDILKCLDTDIPVQIIHQSLLENTSVFKKAWRAPRKAILYLFERLKGQKYNTLDVSNPTILIFEGLYDIDFLISRLGKVNIIYYKTNALYPVNPQLKSKKKNKKKLIKKVQAAKEVHTLEDLIINEISEHFNRNIDNYVESVQHLAKISKKYPIQIGLSGNASTYGIKPLILESLRETQVPVVISQHGFNYGIQDPFGMHLYSDFNRCDYFFSYGFNSKDVDALYNQRTDSINCKIIPVGSTRLKPKCRKGGKKIDILYPLMNTISMLHQGLFRIKPDDLAYVQEKLLQYLDSKTGVNIIVKPFLNYNNNNCAVIPVLQRLKNVTVMDNIHFKESFTKYDVTAVLIDHISSPMAEAIPYDVEIFTLGNEADKIELNALDLLKKRVYYSEKIDEMVDLIDRQLDNRLIPKRDRLFMDRYLLQNNTELNIETFIKEHTDKSCAVS